MDMKIGVKTNKSAKCPFIAYFGFYDYGMEKAGADEPYRHVDGDGIEYTRTVYGYRVTVKNAYDLTNGRYMEKGELKELKIMYARIEDDYEDHELETGDVWIEPDQFNESWMDVINFM